MDAGMGCAFTRAWGEKIKYHLIFHFATDQPANQRFLDNGSCIKSSLYGRKNSNIAIISSYLS